MTAHDRHRDALERLADDAYVRSVLDLGEGWSRLEGRFHFDAEPFASLTLYKRDARLLVEVSSGLRFESRLGEQVARAFRAGYGPLDDQRLLAHRSRRGILKALRAATALRPDGDARAARRSRHGVVVDSV